MVNSVTALCQVTKNRTACARAPLIEFHAVIRSRLSLCNIELSQGKGLKLAVTRNQLAIVARTPTYTSSLLLL